MSDSKTSPANGGDAGKPAMPDKNQEVSFTYPEGFNIAANSFDFLPEELRVQTLTGLIYAAIRAG